MWVTHSGFCGSSAVYVDRLSAIRAANVADNNGNNDFFQSRNPGIEPRQSRDFGIGKVGRDPRIPGYGIPGLQSLAMSLTVRLVHFNFCTVHSELITVDHYLHPSTAITTATCGLRFGVSLSGSDGG